MLQPDRPHMPVDSALALLSLDFSKDAARGKLQAAAQLDDDQGNIFLEVFNQSVQYCTTTLYYVHKSSVFLNISDEDTAGSKLQAAAQLDYGQGDIAC